MVWLLMVGCLKRSCQQAVLLRHLLLLYLPTIIREGKLISLCGNRGGHIDFIFMVNQIIGNGIKCIAHDIDKIKFPLHAC